MSAGRSVGRDVPRVDGLDKVTGAAQYTADLKFPRLLHVAVVRSPHPHARVLDVRTGLASRAPGVRAVASGRDFPLHTGIYLKDQTVFATDRVRFVGDPVAAVAAESPEAAAEAALLVEVDYEPLPPIFDVEEGMAEGAPLVHPDLGRYEVVPWIQPKAGTNVCNHLKIRKGDYEKALSGSWRVFQNTFRVPQVQHVPLEPHVSVARVDLSGKVEVHTSAQSPFTVRHLLAACFGLSHGDVRVHVPYVGGGFGGKAGINLEPIAVALAMRCRGRWVRLMVDRHEEFFATVVRQGLSATLVTGVDRSGKVQAQKMHYLWNCGAYGGYGVNIVRAAGYTCGGAYEFPNVWGDSIGVYTNRPVGSAYRGFGMQEIHWALEQQMDRVALEMGIDPVEFRLMNCLGAGKSTVTGQVLDEHAGRVDLCIRRVAEEIGLDPARERRPYRGKGIACAVKAPAMPNDAASSVVLKFAEDATLEILIAGIDYGQGLMTVAAQFAAEALDIPLETIRVKGCPDTDLSPYDWQTVASRQTWATGNAVLRAASEIGRQLCETSAEVLSVPAADLTLRGGHVVHEPTGRSIPLTRLVMGYQFPDGHAIGGPVAATTSYLPEGLLFLDPETSQSAKPVAKWTFGAQAVEISVDPETGQVTVEKVAACYDVGRVVNPGLIRGQTYGGIVQGIGTGTMEELVLDPKTGRALNASLMDYKIPSTEDVPTVMTVDFVETPQKDGPMGARGIGEHTMIPTPAAIANALFDACGVRISEMPITAEKVWRALKEKEKVRCRTPLPCRPLAAGPFSAESLARHLSSLPVPARTVALLTGIPRGNGSVDSVTVKWAHGRTRALVGTLRSGDVREVAYQPDVAALTGLGPGLTPTGDDLLVGLAAMASRLGDAGLVDPRALRAYGGSLGGLASASTTPAALALLGNAANGLYPSVLAAVVESLGNPDVQPETLLERAARLAAVGAHSGADLLAGALALALGIVFPEEAR